MYFSEAILSGTGPLAKVWLAAHWERKLTKTQFLQTDISSSIKTMQDEREDPIALRLSGQLLLGVVRIYSRKTRYLLEDCGEASMRIRLVFQPVSEARDTSSVDLHKGRKKRPETIHEAITLQDRITEHDLLHLGGAFNLGNWTGQELDLSTAPSDGMTRLPYHGAIDHTQSFQGSSDGGPTFPAGGKFLGLNDSMEIERARDAPIENGMGDMLFGDDPLELGPFSKEGPTADHSMDMSGGFDMGDMDGASVNGSVLGDMDADPLFNDPLGADASINQDALFSGEAIELGTSSRGLGKRKRFAILDAITSLDEEPTRSRPLTHRDINNAVGETTTSPHAYLNALPLGLSKDFAPYFRARGRSEAAMDENALPLEEQHEGDSFVEAFAEGLAFPEEDGDLPQVFEEGGMRDMGEMEDAFAMPESVAPLLSTQMTTQEMEESVGGKCGVIAVLRTRAAAPTPTSRGKVQATRYTDLLEESRGMEVALIQEEGARRGVRKGRQRAAQLFYELLQLASKDSITVRQDAPFSEIEIKGKEGLLTVGVPTA